ncbi:MAG: hypothetical protein GF416_04740 [Candidatus Altiarchaeales archaeon]|nr:hypothetical protein [Candidatus Altiarchaeales archaeon]MBD3416427.1 hypothetical protein [Candidatus Altiarchaeales archaeon]
MRALVALAVLVVFAIGCMQSTHTDAGMSEDSSPQGDTRVQPGTVADNTSLDDVDVDEVMPPFIPEDDTIEIGEML